MKRFILTAALALTAGATLSMAQSSGSFNFAANTTQCTNIGGLLGGGVTQTSISTALKVSSGNGVAVVVRPSAVTGLLTDLKLSSSALASSQAAIQFQVTATPLSGQAAPTVVPSAPVTYDDRYISIQTNLFDALATQCSTIVGGCFFNFNETTLSAHSFDFVITNLSAGDYKLTVTWQPTTSATAPSTAQACVGPVVLTATQVKLFNQSTAITF